MGWRGLGVEGEVRWRERWGGWGGVERGVGWRRVEGSKCLYSCSHHQTFTYRIIVSSAQIITPFQQVMAPTILALVGHKIAGIVFDAVIFMY